MTTVVLGWDGLDYALLQRYGMAGRFGDEAQPVETIINDELGKPHTWELWPSMITGVGPDTHGIHAETFIESNWSSPILRAAATLSKPIPDTIRWRVGRFVRSSGAEIAFRTADSYDEETVFDGRDGVPIGIPNYRSQFDERYGVTSDRGAELGEYLQTTTGADGDTYREATVPPEVFAGRIAADAGEKIALVQHALRSDPDIVWAWLALVDTAGHVAPTIASPDVWMQDIYEMAAEFTDQIRRQLDADDELVCVSDHGLQDGAHTDTACIAGDGGVVAGVDHVLDLAPAIERVTPSTAETAGRFEGDGDQSEEVRQRLEDLGYV